MDIAAFLTDRLDEDARVALAVTADDWGAGDEDSWERQEWQDLPERAFAHARRHDPARVLADVAAKRAIVAEHRTEVMRSDGGPRYWCTTCHVPNDNAAYRYCVSLRALTQSYVNHPDYEPAWNVQAATV